MQIGIFGTFDVENYGDLLFPIVAERELSDRLSNIQIIPHSYCQKSAQNWPYDVTAIENLSKQVPGLDGIIVGGGHLIRFDKAVAPGYRPLHPKLHHPTSYWLAPALTAAAAGLPLVWNAPSASSNTPVWAKPLLRLALDLSSYVSVRDRATLDEIRAIGFDGGCEIIPDTVFAISNLCPQARAEEIARPFLEQCGIQRNYIVVHAQGYALPLAKALSEREDILTNYDILILPIGPILGDDIAPFVEILPTAKHLPHWPTPTVIASLVACSSGVIATSLHLTITALSFGVPVLRPDMPDAPKYRFLSSISSVSFASTADTLPPSFVRQLGHRELSSFALDAKKKLSGHWDRVALALENGKHQPHHFISRVQSLWNEVPLAADEMESAADTTAQTLRTRLDVVTDELRSAEERANRQEQLYDRVQEQIDDLGSALNSKLSGIEAELSTLNPSLSTITLKVASLRSQADLAASASAARHSKLVGADAKISQKLDDIYRNVRRRRRLKKLLKKIASVGAFAKISSAKEGYQAQVVPKSPYADDIRGSEFFDVAFYLEQAGGAAKNDPYLHYVLHGERLGLAPSPRFDPRFYREKYPDVVASKHNLLWHFIRYGKQEGRNAVSTVAKLSISAEHLDSTKKTVLVLVHQASRTGAPILGWNIIRQLKLKYNIVAVILHGGTLVDEFDALADVRVGPLGGLHQRDASALAHRLDQVFSPLYAIANSVETRILVPALSKKGIPVVSLVHEFSSYTFPTGSLEELLAWSGEIVFPAQIVADSSLHDYPKLRTMRWHVHAQGPSLVPLGASRDSSIDGLLSYGERLRRRLRPDGMEDAFVVVGMGFIDSRKGVDLFLSTATSVVSGHGGRKIRFVWIGDGLQKESSRADSNFYLKEQIERAGLGNAFEIFDAVDDVEVIYDSADVLFLSSRLDPLPNVSIDALLRGLPVVCFENASGAADILVQDPKTKEIVVGYCDVAGAARVIVRLASDADFYSDVSESVKTVAQNTFNMPRYIEFIDDLAVAAAARISEYSTDAELLSQPDNFEPTMYTGSNDQYSEKLDLVMRYLSVSGKTDYYRIPPPGVHPRKALPGFHPFTYATACPKYSGGDPLVHYIKSGRPAGAWAHDIIRLDKISQTTKSSLKTALHIHLHYTENLEELIDGLRPNASVCDLFISTTSDESAAKISAAFRAVKNSVIRIDVVPNRGRDIKPYLGVLDSHGPKYELFGHIHAKRSVGLAEGFGERWRKFLWQNLIGPKYPAIDIIAAKFLSDSRLGLVFPEEPHVVGWENNLKIGEMLAERMGIPLPLPLSFDFPVGTMFWARPAALTPLLNLSQTFDGYPAEPLPSDGTVLHAIERILPIVTQHSGFKIATTHCSDITR